MSIHGLVNHFFLALNSIPLPRCITVYLHKGCFRVLAIMIKAAVKSMCRFFGWMLSFQLL